MGLTLRHRWQSLGARVLGGLPKAVFALITIVLICGMAYVAIETSKNAPQPPWSWASWVRWWNLDKNAALIAGLTAAGNALSLFFAAYAVLWSKDAKEAEQRHFARLADLEAGFGRSIGRVGVGVAEVIATQAEHTAALNNVTSLVRAMMAQRGAEIAGAGAEQAVITLARRTAAHVADFAQAMAELEAMVDELLQRRTTGSNLAADVDAILRRIDERALAGAFEAADREAARAFADWEAREAERRAREQAIGLKFIAENIRTKRLLRDAEGVAMWIARQAAMQAGVATAGLVQLAGEIERLIDSGRDRGVNLDLEIAAALARIAESQAINAQGQAAAQVWRGIALQRLGARVEGAALLDAAVAAFHAALGVYTREAFPPDWALTQNNLSNVLAILGEREEGTHSLDAAVAACRAALEVYTRAAFPLGWAMTQHNLGNALQSLGEREEGTVSLDAAVVAYRAVLDFYTREALPLQWASTQNNLGNALQSLGQREEGTASLDAAVVAYRAVLAVYTREALPLDWAMTQNNLGNALKSLGEREEGTASLDAAVVAYRAALEVRTREALPLNWATTQNNLGNALQSLGEREEGTASLDAAVAAYRAALEVFAQPGLGYYRSITDQGLAQAHARRLRGEV